MSGISGGEPAAPSRLLSEGLLATPDAVASATEWQATSLTGPERVLRTRLMRGLELDIVESRGFDIGAASFAGVPIAWYSPVRDARALAVPRGLAWVSRFNGGLVTTCGLRNIGPPKGDDGQHGDFSHRPAQQVSWRTWVGPDGSGVEATALVEDIALLGPSLTVRRTITSSAPGDGSSATVRLVDVVENVGTTPADLAILYHVNLGAPLVAPGTTVDVDAASWQIREPNPLVPSPGAIPEPTDALTEAVFEHHGLRADDDGWGQALVRNDSAGLAVRIRWSLSTLPRLYQWVLPTRGRWALGVEPANAALFGGDEAALRASADRLEPGETRTLALIIDVVQGG